MMITTSRLQIDLFLCAIALVVFCINYADAARGVNAASGFSEVREWYRYPKNRNSIFRALKNDRDSDDNDGDTADGNLDDENVCAGGGGIVYLSSEADICGASLFGDFKYIIETREKKVECPGGGPIIGDGAILDCNGVKIEGGFDSDDSVGAGTSVGILMFGGSIVENCEVKDMDGDGIVLVGDTPERSMIYNSKAEGNRFIGIFVTGDEGGHIAELVDVETKKNLNGIAVETSGITYIRSPKSEDNINNGLRFDVGSLGTAYVFDVESKKNGLNGINHRSPGNLFIERGKIEDNGLNGIVKQTATSGFLQIRDVEIEDNDDLGFLDTASGSSPTVITGSVIKKNGIGGVSAINSPILIECCSITDNDIFGLRINDSMVDVIDSEIADNELRNIDIINGDVFLERVYACDADLIELRMTGETAVLAEFVACDDSVVCETSCRDCKVKIPAWCTSPLL